MIKKLFKNRDEWRNWLDKNHDKESEIWLVYYKKKIKKPSIKYDEAVEEALCFGWIDSIVKRIDEEKYMQKYTPRRLKSIWSSVNKKRIEKVINEDRMTKYGKSKIDQAKEDGFWNILDTIDVNLEIPAQLLEAFELNSEAKRKFNKLPPSQQKQYAWWIVSAKREDTKKRRINETIKRIIEGRGAGM